MDSNEFGRRAIRNELGYDLAKDINPRDWRTFRIRLLRQQERGDLLLISLCSTCGWANFPTSLSGQVAAEPWAEAGEAGNIVGFSLNLSLSCFFSPGKEASFLIPQHPDKWGCLPQREVLFLDDDETPMPDIIWDSLSGSKNLSWLNCKSLFFSKWR